MARFWLPLAFLLALGACRPEEQTSEMAGARPNILFVLLDDHAFQAISTYDDRLIETPNIDRLAREGMRFDRAYVTNSICSPSRAVILTGKHSHLNGLRDNRQVFDSTQTTFPKLLRRAGYQTAIVGKWHLKSQPTGFDYWKVLPGQGQYYQPDFRTADGMVRDTGYVTDLITDEAIDWLASRRDTSKPFMLMYNHKAPHREWWPAQDHLRAFKNTDIPEPETLFDDYSGRGTAAAEAEMRIHDHMGLSSDNKIHPRIVDMLGREEFMGWYKPVYLRQYNRLTEQQRENWDAVYDSINLQFVREAPTGEALTKWKYQRYMEDYLATIQSVDDNLGRVLDYLDENNLTENTLVVYTSDQGFYLGEHGWFDKRFMYEESYRTPLILRWPGKVEAGSVNANLVQNLDFAQTLLEVAGVAPPEDMQGRSLLPLMAGQQDDWRDALYYHYYEYPGIHAVKRHYGISTQRYKLIHFYHDIDEWELYDLREDPNEMRNVFDDPEYESVKEELMTRLGEIRQQYQDSDSLTQEFLRADLTRD